MPMECSILLMENTVEMTGGDILELCAPEHLHSGRLALSPPQLHLYNLNLNLLNFSMADTLWNNTRSKFSPEFSESPLELLKESKLLSCTKTQIKLLFTQVQTYDKE